MQVGLAGAGNREGEVDGMLLRCQDWRALTSEHCYGSEKDSGWMAYSVSA